MDSYTLSNDQKQINRLLTNNRKQTRLRFYYIIILAGVAIVTEWLANGYSSDVSLYIAITITGLIANLILKALTEVFKAKLYQQRILAASQVIVDLLLAAYVIASDNAIDSRASILFAVPIIISGILFSRRIVLTTAGVASVVYVLIIIAAFNSSTMETSELLVPVLFYPAVFFVLAATTNNLLSLSSARIESNIYEEVLALLTHQLRQPYGTVGGLLDLISANQQLLSKDQRRYVKLAQQENKRGLEIINNLLHVATIDKTANELNPVDTDLAAKIKEAAQRIALARNRQHNLVLSGTHHCHALVDPLKIGLALDNVIDNAFKFSPDDTPVKVAVHAHHNEVVITVSNQGKGIPDQLKQSIFTKYNHDSSKNFDGIGIGLYVSDSIVRAHKGSIAVESEEGKGATFYITIPKGE